jgi:hypothetical protein
VVKDDAEGSAVPIYGASEATARIRLNTRASLARRDLTGVISLQSYSIEFAAFPHWTLVLLNPSISTFEH